jgi:hypothetical protein
MKLLPFILLVSLALFLVKETNSMQSILMVIPVSIWSRKLSHTKQEALQKLKKYVAKHNRIHIIGKRMERLIMDLKT